MKIDHTSYVLFKHLRVSRSACSLCPRLYDKTSSIKSVNHCTPSCKATQIFPPFALSIIKALKNKTWLLSYLARAHPCFLLCAFPSPSVNLTIIFTRFCVLPQFFSHGMQEPRSLLTRVFMQEVLTLFCWKALIPSWAHELTKNRRNLTSLLPFCICLCSKPLFLQSLCNHLGFQERQITSSWQGTKNAPNGRPSFG
jgi:hypothetical protein